MKLTEMTRDMDIGRRIESVRRHEGSSTYYLIGARRGRRVQGLSMKPSDKHRYECPPSCGGLLGWRGASEGGRSCSTSGLCMGGRRARRLLSGSKKARWCSACCLCVEQRSGTTGRVCPSSCRQYPSTHGNRLNAVYSARFPPTDDTASK